MTLRKLTGTAIPLGALYTKENPCIGEYPDLIPFADFCKEAGLKLIQLLPVNDTGTQSSPYSGLSAFALHPIYIRIKDIENFTAIYDTNTKFKKLYDNFIKENNYSGRYNYTKILNQKNELLKLLYDSTQTGQDGKPEPALEKFIKANPWLITYCVYKNLKWNYMQASWKTWHLDDQQKSPEEIKKQWNTMAFKKEHLFYAWQQFIAAEQFGRSVEYIKNCGLLLKGDMPILMNEDSCDAWANPQFFNQNLRAGSPADGENPNGQNWGFPTYNWKNLKENDYSWWKERLNCASKYYDAYRLDHILGFFRIWAIPEADCNALTGHTEPFASFKKDDLYELGFDDDRIRWLSKPHVPTKIVEDITWNHEIAHKILETMCEQLHGEELWLFKDSIKGSKQIQNADLSKFVDENAANRIKEALEKKWSDRALLEVSKNKIIPMWTYGSSTAWGTLSKKETEALTELFEGVNKKNEKLWKKQAEEIFEAITKNKMIPCGEDLGVGIACVPETMKKHNILGLRVVRWSREWSEEGQPYVPFEDYTPLSVTTTSVHDSSTIRQWWTDEKESVRAFIKANEELFEEEAATEEFSPELAEKVLKASSSAASLWYIPPLQDFLYLSPKYYLENADGERINVPGTVNDFNWTYRIPCAVEDLAKNKNLIEKIKKIAKRS
ncbi:MAG: 4-alpha-glucanotransferase [Treponema sp.]|nr:4-alpha-glucanotransferase [Treponema sp.]